MHVICDVACALLTVRPGPACDPLSRLHIDTRPSVTTLATHKVHVATFTCTSRTWFNRLPRGAARTIR